MQTAMPRAVPWSGDTLAADADAVRPVREIAVTVVRVFRKSFEHFFQKAVFFFLLLILRVCAILWLWFGSSRFGHGGLVGSLF